MKRSVLLIKPERKQRIPLPHYLLINGQMLGLMRGNDNVRVALPQGDYAVTVRSAYKFIESTAQVHIAEGETLTLTFGDRERWWNWWQLLGHRLRGCQQRFLHPLASAYLDHPQALFPDDLLTGGKTIISKTAIGILLTLIAVNEKEIAKFIQSFWN